MKRIRTSNHPTLRATAVAVALGLLGMASADLRFNVSVTTSTSYARPEGVPSSGSYEIDFRAGQARVVEPDGTVLLFDFKASKVTVMNSTLKTFYTQSLAETLKSDHQDAAAPTLAESTNANSQTFFGANAYKFSIRSNTASSGATLGALAGGSTTTTTSRQLANLEGDAWLADGSETKGFIGSIAPIVLISAPSFLASSLTDQLNSLTGIPVSMSLVWSNTDKSTGSTDMVVTGVESVTLDAALFETPSQYKPTQKPRTR